MTQRRLLALGGSLRSGSLTASALRVAVDHARSQGHRAEMLTTADLALPLLDPDLAEAGSSRPEGDSAIQLLAAVEDADALLVGTPVYGGTPSGAVKNILDTLHLGKSGVVGPLAGRRVGVLSVGGGSLTGQFEFQRGATSMLAIACRNLGAWVEPRHVELSELAFGTDGDLDDVLAHVELTDLVDRLLGDNADAVADIVADTQGARS